MMIETSYLVHVVVNPALGERLREIPAGEPVWIADTEGNRPAYEVVARERDPADHLTGYSTFKVDSQGGPEEWFISELAAIDLHHGEMSHDPPYSALNVIGVAWSERIQKELDKFGFQQHEATPDGFVTTRKVGQPGD